VLFRKVLVFVKIKINNFLVALPPLLLLVHHDHQSAVHHHDCSPHQQHQITKIITYNMVAVVIVIGIVI
jgi:hypothetical protein